MQLSPAQFTILTTDSTAFATEICREENAPTLQASWSKTATTTVAYTEGIPPQERHTTPGENSGVLTLIIATFLLVAFNFKHCSRLFGTFAQDLWSVRRRANAFDDHTAKESRTLIILIFQTCVYLAILLFTQICNTKIVPDNKVFGIVGVLTLLTSSFYLLQLLAYTVIGHVFSDRIGATQWIKGFNASPSLLGFFIIIPSLTSLFYSNHAASMFTISAIFYFIARVIFISKGFRIFYHNFGSLLYFILYLCTLEIIPIIWVYSGAVFLVDFLL